jgi:hypothetical protein
LRIARKLPRSPISIPKAHDFSHGLQLFLEIVLRHFPELRGSTEPMFGVIVSATLFRAYFPSDVPEVSAHSVVFRWST